MVIVAVQRGLRPGGFYSAARSGLEDLPYGVRLHSMLQSRDGSRSSCLAGSAVGAPAAVGLIVGAPAA